MQTQLVLFLATFFESGEPKYVAGVHYPETAETKRLAGTGIAKLVTVDLSADRAEKLAAQARLAADKAAAAAAEAEALVEAARVAQALADDAAAALAVVEETGTVQTSAQAPEADPLLQAPAEPAPETPAPEEAPAETLVEPTPEAPVPEAPAEAAQ